jgi:hypothetical protein
MKTHRATLPKLNGVRNHTKSTPVLGPGNNSVVRERSFQGSELLVEIVA